jgi:mono/diheme cytochrome c family protein
LPRCVAALVLATASCSAFASARATLDGAFTADQAERGKQVYAESCFACHQVEFYEMKLAAWQGATVGELFAAVSATMPSANPGGLTSQQYLDVLAYIFSITGSPPGDDELTLVNADAIEISPSAAAPSP